MKDLKLIGIFELKNLRRQDHGFTLYQRFKDVVTKIDQFRPK